MLSNITKTTKMSKDLNITVVTVSYNAVSTIEETIRSVVDQTYPNVEYIIIDGGSTDGTVDTIKKYAKNGSEYNKHNHGVSYWVSEPDNGIYDAMNKSLVAGTGDYIYFLGGDDTLKDKNVFSRIAESMRKDPSCIYYSNVQFKNSEKIYPGPITSNYRICLDNFSHQGIFYPKSIYKNKKYNTNYKLWADYVYNIELFADKQNIFKYIDDVIAIFCCDGRGSVQDDKLFVKNRINLVKELFGLRLAAIIKFRIFMGKTYKRFFKTQQLTKK